MSFFIANKAWKLFLDVLISTIIFTIFVLALSSKVPWFFADITDNTTFKWAITLHIVLAISLSFFTLLPIILWVKFFSILSYVLGRFIFVWALGGNMTWFSTAITNYFRVIIGDGSIVLIPRSIVFDPKSAQHLPRSLNLYLFKWLMLLHSSFHLIQPLIFNSFKLLVNRSHFLKCINCCLIYIQAPLSNAIHPLFHHSANMAIL